MRYLLFFMSLFALAACAQHETDYLKKGETVPPLVIPSNVPVIKQAAYYPVPTVPGLPPAKPNSLVPPTLSEEK